MTSEPDDDRSGLWSRLRGDFWFWLGTVTLLLSALPYFLPILTADQLWAWGWIYADVPSAIVGWAAVAVGVRTLPSGAERTFWTLITVAYGATLGIEVANAFVPETAWDHLLGLLLDSGYMVYYAALVLAATAAGSLAKGDGVRHLHRLRAIGLAILGIAYLIYFQTVPSQPRFDGPSWYPALMLYAALDLVVCLVLMRAGRESEDPRWRGILFGLAALNGMYALLDSWEAALYIEPWASIEIRPQWDLFWYLPEFIFLAYARGYLTQPDRAVRHVRSERPRRPDRGLMLVGLLALPLLHSLLYFLGVLDEQYRETREGVVVLFLLAMGGTLWSYFRALERERARTTRASVLGEERYRNFLRRRVDGIYRAEASAPIPLSAPVDEQLDRIREQMRVEEVTDPGAVLHDGSPAEAAVGRRLVDVIPGSGDAEPIRAWIRSSYRSDFEVTRDLDEGERQHLRYTLTGIIENDALVRAWLTRSDLSDERNALERTERLARELERARKLESIGTLAGGIAHDFNNLLLPIIGYTEIARNRIGADDEDARESLGYVLGASERAAELVRQILAASRPQRGTEALVRVEDVVEDALALLRPGLPESIQIEAVLADCPAVLGDAGRIHQVVMNVCTNAAHAMSERGGQIRVTLEHDDTVAPDAPLGWVKLSISDDGSGMDAASLDRIFEPFYTTREPGLGTGLGLSVVHGIVAGHNGRIDVDSDPGVGTTFTVRLPVSDTSVPERSSEDPPVVRPLRVLVIDDRPDVAAVTHRLLESAGHSVLSFTDPARLHDAVALGARDGPRWDVLVADSKLDSSTGLELLTALRSIDPDLGIVVSSGHGSDVDSDRTDHIRITKPFSAEEISTAVQRAHQQVVSTHF